MTTKSRRTILGDSTNTYYNYCPPLSSLPRSKSFNTQGSKPEIRTQHSYESTAAWSEEPLSASSHSSSTIYEVYSDQNDTMSNYSCETGDSTVLNCSMKQKKKPATDETKYKTEMCKNWLEVGKCNYGKKCKFAHGKHELHEKHVANRCRYKSKKCNSFFTNMFCPYGVRCMFAHEQRTAEEINSDNYYGKYLQFPDLMEDPHTKSQRRLSVFKNLEQSGAPDSSRRGSFFPSKENSFFQRCSELRL